jgi:purine nucleosidase
LHDAVALLAVTNPELFSTQRMAGDVETGGELTTGATVFDRRPRPEWRFNMEVALEVDVPAAIDAILRGLAQAGRAG